jgi:hypothetical protein
MWAQVRCQLFLGVEYPPLDGADGEALSGGDLVVLPILYKAQDHRFPFLGIEKLHPIIQFCGRSAGISTSQSIFDC